MYDKFIANFIIIIVFLFSLTFTSSALAHKKKNHKPLKCIPEEERTPGQRQNDKCWNSIHRLSKLQQGCAMLEIEKLKGVPQVKCGNIPFGHISSASTSLRSDSNKKAEKIGKIKKGDELLFISEAAGNKNWALVKARLGKDDCAEGFILTKLILQKAEVSVTPGSFFGKSNYFRVCYAIENNFLLEALDRISDAFSLIK